MHFSHFTGMKASDRLRMLIFEFNRSKTVYNDTSLVIIGNVNFGGHFGHGTQQRGPLFLISDFNLFC